MAIMIFMMKKSKFILNHFYREYIGNSLFSPLLISREDKLIGLRGLSPILPNKNLNSNLNFDEYFDSNKSKDRRNQAQSNFNAFSVKKNLHIPKLDSNFKSNSNKDEANVITNNCESK